jgi:hypothetical protein
VPSILGEDDMNHEQRRAARVPVDLPARYRSGEVFLDGRAGNLSQDGMFFVCSLLDDGDGREVVVELDLPDCREPLALQAEVRWVDVGPLLSGMGLHFVNVALQEKLQLANFVLRAASHAA